MFYYHVSLFDVKYVVLFVEKLRLRQVAKATAEKKVQKNLAKKQSDSRIAVNRLKKKKLSMDEISIVTLDSRANQKYSPAQGMVAFVKVLPKFL